MSERGKLCLVECVKGLFRTVNIVLLLDERLRFYREIQELLEEELRLGEKNP